MNTAALSKAGSQAEADSDRMAGGFRGPVPTLAKSERQLRGRLF